MTRCQLLRFIIRWFHVIFSTIFDGNYLLLCVYKRSCWTVAENWRLYTEQPREIQCESEHAQVTQFPPCQLAERLSYSSSRQSWAPHQEQSARRHTRVASTECTGPTYLCTVSCRGIKLRAVDWSTNHSILNSLDQRSQYLRKHQISPS